MSARINPHKSWSRLSAARQRKAASVERKGLRLIGKRSADASKGERLRRRGVTSGTGKMFRGGTHTEGPIGRLPNPTLPGATRKIREISGDNTLYVVRGLYGYSVRSVTFKRQTGTVYKTLGDLYAAVRGGERPQEKQNPTPNEWDDETLNEAARLGSTQARALGRSERASRTGPRFFNVTWFSPTRQRRVGFIRPIEATSASDAKRQAKAMVTNEKAINIVAKPTRRNGDAVTRRNPKNPGIMEIAGGLQALDYLGEKVGVSGKRKRSNPKDWERFDPKWLTWLSSLTVAELAVELRKHRARELEADAIRAIITEKDRKRKRNPSVNEMSKRFQGRATGKTEDYYFSDSAPRLDMSRGGKLVFLKLKGTTIRVPASVVAIDPKSEKLWLGSKSATGMFKRKASKGERLDYGDIDAICYLTAKTHIGKGKQYEYVHTFGEDGGRKPRLLIDYEGMPILQGGDYKIEDRGIVN